MLNFNYRFIVLIREPQINYRLWQISIMHRFFTMTHPLFIRKERWRKHLDGHFKKFTEHNFVIFSTKNCGSLHEFQVFHVTIFIVAICVCFGFFKFHPHWHSQEVPCETCFWAQVIALSHNSKGLPRQSSIKHEMLSKRQLPFFFERWLSILMWC